MEFKYFVNSFKNIMKQNKYRKKGNSFYTYGHGNVGLIHFQKSSRSDSSKTIFTVNIGTKSSSICEFEGDNFESLEVSTFHWISRIGEFLPNRLDKWWSYKNTHESNIIISEISKIIVEIAIPEINSKIQDESLLSMWMVGRAPGLTQLQRLEYLSILLKKFNMKDELGNVIDELKRISHSTSSEAMVDYHISRLTQ